MCGRFTLIESGTVVAEAFGLGGMPELAPRYNVAPTQQVFAVRASADGRQGAFYRWGLTPPWSGGMKPLFNARAETAATKLSFRAAFKQRRCLVPATGFYEWKAEGKRRLPHLFTVQGCLFAIAGLWEDGRDFAESCCLLTTEANEVVRAVHDRMPVILPRDAWPAWLDPASEPSALQGLLRPYPAERMGAVAVGDYVSSARNEGPRCAEPAGQDAPAQRSLF
jgi:putative SOS response-associated peptidase YedK